CCAKMAPEPIPPIANPCCNRVLFGVVPASGKAMRRRDFIKVIAGSATSWPLAARAQQFERMRRIGVLMGYPENDPEAQTYIAAFRDGLGKLGWMEATSGSTLAGRHPATLSRCSDSRKNSSHYSPTSFFRTPHPPGRAAATNANHSHR